MESILKRFKYFCQHTSTHGVKYAGDTNRHYLVRKDSYGKTIPGSMNILSPKPGACQKYRLFWAMTVIINFYGMLLFFRRLFITQQDNAISFVTETTYLDWNTTFPAITVCQISNTEFATDDEENDSETENSATIELFIADILFFTGSCYSCQPDCTTCSTFNFTNLVSRLRKKCPELLQTCKWNNEEFNCCDKFLPLETEYGICYSLNSLHTTETEKSYLNLDLNRKTGPGEIFLKSIEDIRIYYHAPEDVPFINSEADHRKDVMLGEAYNISFNVIEISNDENVKYLPIEKRKCRFPSEKPHDLVVHDYYSYSTCIVQCHAENHIKLCNCTHHLMPFYNKEKYCDIEGLRCLTENFDTVNRLHAKGFDKPGLVCDCLPSCVEPEFKIVSDTKGDRSSHSEIYIKMQSLPTSRFKRVVIRTSLDLVVSFGGTAGLFLGASLLSIMEFFYLIFVRKYSPKKKSKHRRRGVTFGLLYG